MYDSEPRNSDKVGVAQRFITVVTLLLYYSTSNSTTLVVENTETKCFPAFPF